MSGGYGASSERSNNSHLAQGYAAWSIVVYGFIVSTVEMVTVYPYCHGTVGLGRDRGLSSKLENVAHVI